MDHPGPVRGVERRADFAPDAKDLVERERPAGDPLGERLAVEELHHEVLGSLVRADVVDGADPRVGERGGRSRLALEALAHLGIARRTAPAGP